jgi:hypothetical protein
MTWVEEWRALAARIDGLVRAGEFLVSALKVYSSDVRVVVKKSVIPELQAIGHEIKQFTDKYSDELSVKAVEALNRYTVEKWDEQAAEHSTPQQGAIAIQVLAPLAAFRSEFEYLIRDSEIEGRNLTELAFEHLRRQIVVDEETRNKWQSLQRPRNSLRGPRGRAFTEPRDLGIQGRWAWSSY